MLPSSRPRTPGSAWLPILIAVAILPAVFVPVPAVTDFFYLPKVLVLLASEIVLVLELVRRGGKSVAANPLAMPLLVYWAVLVASTWRSVDPWRSLIGEPMRWEGLLTLLLYGGSVLMLPAAASNGVTQEISVATRIDQLLRWGAVVATAIVAYGLVQRYGLDPAPRDALRTHQSWWHTAAFATLGNSNFFGTFAAVYLALAASRHLAGGRGWLAGAAVTYYGMLTSLSRGSWLAGAGAVLLLLAVMVARSSRQQLPQLGRRVVTLALTLTLLTVLWMLADPMASGRMSAFVQDTANQTGTVGQRLWIWRGTINAIRESPWLGYGLDTLGTVFPRFEPPGRAAVGLANAVVDRAHNDFLQVAVSSGLVGLAAYLWLLTAAARSAWGVIAGSAATDLERELAWALSGGAMAHLLAMLTNLSTVSESPTFWGLLGAIAALAMTVRARTPVT